MSGGLHLAIVCFVLWVCGFLLYVVITFGAQDLVHSLPAVLLTLMGAPIGVLLLWIVSFAIVKTTWVLAGLLGRKVRLALDGGYHRFVRHPRDRIKRERSAQRKGIRRGYL
jgi:hypothetical protein